MPDFWTINRKSFSLEIKYPQKRSKKKLYLVYIDAWDRHVKDLTSGLWTCRDTPSNENPGFGIVFGIHKSNKNAVLTVTMRILIGRLEFRGFLSNMCHV